MEQRILPSQLVAAIHDYLMTRPMREVEGMVVELRNAGLFAEAKPKKKA